MVPAAQLVRSERLAPTLAAHHLTMHWRTPHLQLLRARLQQVGPAAYHRAHPFPFVRRHRHGEVETVHQADAVGRVVREAVVKGELGQSGRGGPTGTVALDAAAAVARHAGEFAANVDAAGSSPDPAGPVARRGGEGAVGESVEGEAASFQDVVAGVRLYGWPYGEGAIVNDGQNQPWGRRSMG